MMAGDTPHPLTLAGAAPFTAGEVLPATAGRTASTTSSHVRQGSLDVVRALAIVVVVNCHSGSAFASSPLGPILQLGGKGVELFFVLSGWLLGRLLLLELQRSNTIDLRRFWSRRWLRTLPAYYAVLALISAYLLVTGSQPLRVEYLFFGQTYLTSMPYFGISWSLCVEEHFYLLVAPTLLVAWRYPATRWALPVLILLPSVCRAYGWFGADYQTHVWYDACATGVLLAAASVAKPDLWKRLAPAASWVALVSILVVIKDVALTAQPAWREAWGPLGGNAGASLYALVFGTWVWAAAVHPHWAIGRMPGVRYIAERSYAIYLLHLEMIAVVRHLPAMPFALRLVLVWAGSIAVAEILYRLVERPGMQLRDRYASTRSVSSVI